MTQTRAPSATGAPRAGQPQPGQPQPQPGQPATGQPTASQPPERALAPWWRRLLAFVIDALVLTIATGALWGRLIASFVSRMSIAESAGANGTPADPGAVSRVIGHTVGPYLIVLVFTICLAVTYYWLLTGYWGTTIGKRSLGTWVVSARDGSPAGLRASFVRAVVFVLGGEVVPLFFPADNLWLTTDPRRQCLHDKVARTLVVTTAPHGRGPAQAG